jgi:hypothetical protein
VWGIVRRSSDPQSAEIEASQIFSAMDAAIWAAGGNAGGLDFATMVGSPDDAEQYWNRQMGNTCGIQATVNVLQSLGINTTTQELWKIAKEDERVGSALLGAGKIILGGPIFGGLVFGGFDDIISGPDINSGTNYGDYVQMFEGMGVEAEGHPGFGTDEQAAIDSLA